MPKSILQSSYLYALGYRDAISLGKCFHYGRHTKKDLKRARSYYLEATKQEKPEPFYQLSKLAEEEGLFGESFYYLGRSQEYLNQWQKALAHYKQAGTENYAPALYRAGLLFTKDRHSTPEQTIKKDLIAELMWYRKAAGIYSAHALDALVTLSAEEAKAALHLAQMYEKGELGNKKILSTAIDYYDKASKLGDPVAAYRLGQLYEWGEETFESNQRKAFDYYLIAAKKQDKKSLEGLERITSQLNDSTLQLQLAKVYENNFYNPALALDSYKQLADKDHKIALDRLNLLANRYANCAYKLARSYENENPQHLEKSYQYYALAMHHHHPDAGDYLLSLAKSGHADAQYALAYFHYHHQRHFLKAIRWCLLAADQGHTKASDYIHNTVFPISCYLALAKNYEQGKNGVAKNKDHVLSFYEKALAEKDKEAAFRLGLLHQFDNEAKAFDYFLRAAQWGYREALLCLERLGTEMDPDRQLQLFNLYRTAPFNDQKRALYWCRQATEGSSLHEALSKELIAELFETKEEINIKKLASLCQPLYPYRHC